MADTRCKISVREDMTKYLTVVPMGGPPNTWGLALGEIDAPRGTDWIIQDIPETRSKLLIKHGGAGDGEVVTWVGGANGHILVRQRKVGWEEQVCRFDELDGGYVAINNHDRTRVFDRWPEVPEWVISYHWVNRWNQYWFLHLQNTSKRVKAPAKAPAKRARQHA